MKFLPVLIAAIAVVAAARQLGDGVCLGMEHVGFGHIVLLTDILEAAGGSVVSIADDHLVLDHQSTYLSALAITVFCPNASHTKVSQVELGLLIIHRIKLYIIMNK